MDYQKLGRYAELAVVGVAIAIAFLGYWNVQTATEKVNNAYHDALTKDFLCFSKNTLQCWNENDHRYCKIPGNVPVDLGFVKLNFTEGL